VEGGEEVEEDIVIVMTKTVLVSQSCLSRIPDWDLYTCVGVCVCAFVCVLYVCMYVYI
jgi:hypothetical protein